MSAYGCKATLTNHCLPISIYEWPSRASHVILWTVALRACSLRAEQLLEDVENQREQVNLAAGSVWFCMPHLAQPCAIEGRRPRHLFLRPRPCRTFARCPGTRLWRTLPSERAMQQLMSLDIDI